MLSGGAFLDERNMNANLKALAVSEQPGMQTQGYLVKHAISSSSQPSKGIEVTDWP